MSFEQHPIVASYLAAHEAGLIGYQNELSVYKNIARELYQKVQQFEEKEALATAEIVNPFPMLYKTLNSAAAVGDIQTVDVISKALQRLMSFN